MSSSSSLFAALLLLCLIADTVCRSIATSSIDQLENQISEAVHRVSLLATKPVLLTYASKTSLSPAMKSKMMFDAFERDRPLGVSFWIKSGADLNARNHVGVTALELAVTHRWHSVVGQLLDHGADCRVTSVETGETLLHRIVRQGSDDSLGRLLIHCADIDAIDRIKRRSALHLAAAYGRFDLVQLFVDEAGADVNVADAEGLRPIHLAVRNEEIVSFLIARGADVTAQSQTGKMPIHLGVMQNQVASVKALLLAGETLVFATDIYGKTALDYALQIDRTLADMGSGAQYSEMINLLDRYVLG